MAVLEIPALIAMGLFALAQTYTRMVRDDDTPTGYAVKIAISYVGAAITIAAMIIPLIDDSDGAAITTACLSGAAMLLQSRVATYSLRTIDENGIFRALTVSEYVLFGVVAAWIFRLLRS